jgi:hypothetical protein
VIVAVVTMRVVQMAIHKVVHMVTVRHGFVTAPWSMTMIGFVLAALVLRRAAIRIPVIDLYHVFIHVIPVRVVQMPVMKIVRVTRMFDGSVPAVGAVDMVVSLMYVAVAHCYSFPRRRAKLHPAN